MCNDDQKRDSNAAPLEEYKALRREIEEFLKQIAATETYAIGGIAATWAWLATHSQAFDKLYFDLAWGIPFLIALLGAARSWSLYRHVTIIGEYLKEQADKLGMGWENYEKREKGQINTITCFIWCVLLILTLGLAFWHGTFANY